MSTKVCVPIMGKTKTEVIEQAAKVAEMKPAMVEFTGHTKLTGLLGSPVAHSKSPLMHNESFRQLDLDYVYLCFDVPENDLKTAFEGLLLNCLFKYKSFLQKSKPFALTKNTGGAILEIL